MTGEDPTRTLGRKSITSMKNKLLTPLKMPFGPAGSFHSQMWTSTLQGFQCLQI